MSKLLVPFITAGFPELNSTSGLIQILDCKGADYIEVGLPHSDALADGPTIQRSSAKALQNGMNFATLCQQIKETSTTLHRSKLVLFSYYNPLFAYGLHKALQEWHQSGGYGVLCPDIPFEEIAELYSLCQAIGLELIFLVAPNTTDDRLAQIVKLSTNIIYLVSVTGVTGVRQSLSDSLRSQIQAIRQLNPKLKVILGFGIGSRESAIQALNMNVDGIVVGSAIIELLSSHGVSSQLDEFLSELRLLCDEKVA